MKTKRVIMIKERDNKEDNNKKDEEVTAIN